jgi:hypothetical protein
MRLLSSGGDGSLRGAQAIAEAGLFLIIWRPGNHRKRYLRHDVASAWTPR